MSQEARQAPTRIHHLMEPWVAKQPAAPALRDAHGALSYRELHEASMAAEEHLKTLGVRPGDRVLVVGENCVALGVLVLAASRLDAWIVVANSAFESARLRTCYNARDRTRDAAGASESGQLIRLVGDNDQLGWVAL